MFRSTLTISRAYEYGPGQLTSSFIPIPALRRNNASTTLYFLMANSVHFMQPVDDEFFAAHRQVNDVDINASQGGETTMQLYRSDDVAHVIGCATQDQFCVNETACSTSGTFVPASNDAIYLAGTKLQWKTLLFWTKYNQFLGNNEVANIVNGLGASALLARDTFIGGAQAPLPANQWQKEVQHWHAIAMAKMQRASVEYATGPSDSAVQPYIIRPTSKEETYLCQNQVSPIRVASLH